MVESSQPPNQTVKTKRSEDCNKGRPKIYIMIRQGLKKQYNKQQWQQIKQNNHIIHHSVQSKIYENLINSQQLFNKYFQLFYTNNLRLHQWMLQATSNKSQIQMYLNLRLLTKSYQQYRNLMLTINHQVQIKNINKNPLNQVQTQTQRKNQMSGGLKYRQICKQNQRFRCRLRQRKDKQNRSQRWNQTQLDPTQRNQKMVSIGYRKINGQGKQSQRDKRRQKQKQIFKQRFKEQELKPIQQIRKYKIDDLSHQIFDFIANKSLTASLLTFQKPWSWVYHRNNHPNLIGMHHSNHTDSSHKHNKNHQSGNTSRKMKQFRFNSSDQVFDSKNERDSSLHSRTNYRGINNLHNRKKLRYVKNKTSAYHNHNDSNSNNNNPNYVKEEGQNSKDKQFFVRQVKQINNKIFKNHDFHELYMDTFHACDGPRYIFYNYEKHMKGLSEKDKYNTFIRTKNKNKLMETRLTQISQQDNLFKDIKNSSADRIKSSYQFFPFGSAVQEGTKKKISKVVFRRMKKGSYGKFIRK